MITRRNAVFQQDGAGAHNDGAVRSHLRNIGVTTLEAWPSSSPDLSPIENLWNRVQTIVSDANPGGFRSLKHFVSQVKLGYSAVSQTEIDNLVKSFPSRLHKLASK